MTLQSRLVHFVSVCVHITLALLLLACGGQSQTVERSNTKDFVTLASLAKDQVGTFSMREYNLPFQYANGSLQHKRLLQPNIVYIPFTRSASYDFIVYNGNDNAEHDASGTPVPSSGTPNVNVNGDGLYLARVSITGTPTIKQAHYFPPQKLSVSTDFVQNPPTSVRPHRLLGAALGADNVLNIARTIGNDVIVSSISIAGASGLLSSTLPSITPINTTVNQKLQGSLNKNLEYQIMTEVRNSEPITSCMGTAALASGAGSGTQVLTLAYNRGYTFESNRTVVGEMFARYSVYQGNNGSWRIMRQNTDRALDMQELKTVRTHRSCSDAVAAHNQHNEIVVASYTDTGNVRLAFIDPVNRTQTKSYVLRDVVTENSMEIVALLPLIDGLPLSDGSISNKAYALLLRYTGTTKLATYNRQYASLAYFVLNNGTLMPANDNPGTVKFVFPDVVGGLQKISAGIMGNFIAVRVDGYMVLLDAVGNITYGPFVIPDGFGDESGHGEGLFTHTDGSLGWVEYPTTIATSTIRVFSYKM